MARTFIYIILLLASCALAWAFYGTSDDIVHADGVLVPEGEVATVNAGKDATLREALVREGDRVRKGQRLASFDRVEARSLLELGSQRGGLREGLAAKRRDLALRQQQSRIAEANLVRTQEQFAIYRGMFDSGLIAKVSLLDQERSLGEAHAQVLRLKSEVAVLQTAIEEDERRLALLEQQTGVATARGGDPAVERLRRSISQLDHEEVLAPIDGTIAVVALRQPGQMVRAGGFLFAIIPSGRPLVVKLRVPNTGIGRLRIGQTVKLKFDAYSYRRYGIGNATISVIAPDARPLEKADGLFYDVWATLGSEGLTRDGNEHSFMAGMTVKSEIVVERKRLIDYAVELVQGIGD
jgi:multidrug efflux pump subunit AcrA (membrane-fusion protein)